MAILSLLNVASEMFVMVRTSNNGWHGWQEKSVFTHVPSRHVNLLGQKVVF